MLLKNTLVLLTAILVLFQTSGCKKESTTQTPKTPVVYIAGTTQTGTKTLATYWKDGTPTVLSSGVNNEVGLGIYVSGTDVYVCGYETSTSTLAKYWKNGVAVPLTDGSNFAQAYSIFVSGNDVYVSGYEFSPGGIAIAKYWKNGIGVPLTDGTKPSNAMAIFVSGSDVYVAGHENYTTAKFWKNGISTTLTDSGYATSIAVAGTDVYIGGQQSVGGVYVPKYWKNGTAVELPHSNVATYVFGIAVSGADVHTAGATLQAAKAWKNTTAVNLTASVGTLKSSGNGIGIAGSDVYIVGHQQTASKYIASYWKNGQPVILVPDVTTYSTSSGIFIDK